MSVQYHLLIDMVEYHRESDRELDAMLFYATMPDFQRMGPMEIWLKTESSKSLAIVPNYTGSIDAAFGLLYRLLPNWTHSHRTGENGDGRFFEFQIVSPRSGLSHIHNSRAWTLARACTAAAMIGYMALNPEVDHDHDLLQY